MADVQRADEISLQAWRQRSVLQRLQERLGNFPALDADAVYPRERRQNLRIIGLTLTP